MASGHMSPSNAFEEGSCTASSRHVNITDCRAQRTCTSGLSITDKRKVPAGESYVLNRCWRSNDTSGAVALP
ncbi:hypothetical protein BAUCODRAFT_29180 [Baudoinia panamericana UAMH 10762]|uniref:Uncharacterized protein n=1 Tax=Baudoinia panamericana (strain UAMH 10762) TaxID=717646 RepID=M2NNJ2_BAUPA|nr:uncharacterized protein BAUCODRAFT_29180 [Baudoinia panamericana UAMH 10762]EMD00806.1 hypothetical protein BAUCODRAFT_29180 [Baudoinia panamericana UAMH 10762]